MPGEKIEKNPIQVLKVFKMDPEIPPNHSHQELVHAGESYRSPYDERTMKSVTWKEWTAVLILCFVNLINYMDRFTLAGILKDIQDYFHIGDDNGGLLQTAFVLTYMLFAPLFGYLGDRYNRCAIMAFGVFLWSLTTLLGSFMTSFGWFIMFRALVGIGEASYSTIAPTILSDLFNKSLRSKMLAVFYFAIPVGSGLGYIVGSETAKLAGSWQWGLRVTPFLGFVAVILIYFILRNPERGHSEGSTMLEATSWKEDLKDLVKNPSFMLSTAGFTCVSFVAGALAWWGPKYIYMGIMLQPNASSHASADNLSFIFGVITMLAGLVGVGIGCFLSFKFRSTYPKADPIICGIGLLLSSPLILGAMLTINKNSTICFVLLFFGQVTLNLNWAVVSDILLYVVIPTRRSTAEGFQLLISHALGDAGSPYLIGVISESLKIFLAHKTIETEHSSGLFRTVEDDPEVNFRALQYALFITCFVEVIGGLFFLITAFFICKDKAKVDKVIHDMSGTNTDTERRSLVS